MGLFSSSRSSSSTQNNSLELGQQAQGDIGDNQISASNSHLILSTNDSVTNTDSSDRSVTNVDSSDRSVYDASFTDSSVTNIDESDHSVLNLDESFTDYSVSNLDESFTDNSVTNIDNSVNTDHGAVAAAIGFTGETLGFTGELFGEFIGETGNIVDLMTQNSSEAIGAVTLVASNALDEISDGNVLAQRGLAESHADSLDSISELSSTFGGSLENLFIEANSGLAKAFDSSVEVIAANSKSESERGLDSVIDLSKQTMLGLGVLSALVLGASIMRRAA